MSARIFFFGRGPRLSQNASTHGVVNRAPSMEVRRENPLLGRVLEGSATPAPKPQPHSGLVTWPSQNHEVQI